MRKQFWVIATQTSCLGAALTQQKLRVHEQKVIADEESNDRHLVKPNSNISEKRKYSRHIPFPKNQRDFAVFKRDHHYAHYRSGIDLPWRQHKKRTYMDDAERLYGKKETWHTLQNLELKEKLLMLLKDYLRDITAAARAEIRSAEKYKNLCNAAAHDYRKHIALGASGDARVLCEWAEKILYSTNANSLPSLESEEVTDQKLLLTEFGSDSSRRTNIVSSTTGNRNDNISNNEIHINENSNNKLIEEYKSAEENLDDADRAKYLRNATTSGNVVSQRQRPRSTLTDNTSSSNLLNTPALRDLHDSGKEISGVESFPFLRKRAVEFGETLDPSLLDWTAQYYPEDTEKTFLEPPQLRESLTSTPLEENKSSSMPLETEEVSWKHKGYRTESNTANGPQERSTERHMNVFRRLRHSLKTHDDHYKATFDGEGIFYPLRPVQNKHISHETDINSDDAVKWRISNSLRGSTLTRQNIDQLHSSSNRSGNVGVPKVVKVPWDVAAKAHQQGYSSEILRARERLIRLTRGENPSSIP